MPILAEEAAQLSDSQETSFEAEAAPGGPVSTSTPAAARLPPFAKTAQPSSAATAAPPAARGAAQAQADTARPRPGQQVVRRPNRAEEEDEPGVTIIPSRDGSRPAGSAGAAGGQGSGAQRDAARGQAVARRPAEEEEYEEEGLLLFSGVISLPICHFISSLTQVCLVYSFHPFLIFSSTTSHY